MGKGYRRRRLPLKLSNLGLLDVLHHFGPGLLGQFIIALLAWGSSLSSGSCASVCASSLSSRSSVCSVQCRLRPSCQLCPLLSDVCASLVRRSVRVGSLEAWRRKPFNTTEISQPCASATRNRCQAQMPPRRQSMNPRKGTLVIILLFGGCPMKLLENRHSTIRNDPKLS